MTRAAIYTRISQDKSGERLGVTRQLETCQELAEKLGWDVVAHFDDNDTSAYSKRKKRKGYEAMLAAIKNNEIDAIICWHTDRLYRRLGDLEELIQIVEPRKIDIRTVQGGDLDLSTATGRMVARILGAHSNAESEQKGERQCSANKQKAGAGKWQTSNRPFGYTLTGEPLEPEASAYRKAVEDVLAGGSLQGVARAWNAAGLKTTRAGQSHTNSQTGESMEVSGRFSAPRVRRILLNPRYAAIRVHQGKIVGPGNWTALIDVDTYNGVKAVLTNPERFKTVKSFERKYMGSGLYLCGVCDNGTTVKAARPTGRSTRTYVCREVGHLVRSGEPLDDYVTATLLERMSQSDANELCAHQGVDVSALALQREALQSKLNDITRMYDEDMIDADQFATTSRSTRSKLALVDQQLATVTRTSPAAALAAAEDVWALWKSMTPTQRADAVREVMDVTVLPAGRGRQKFSADFVRIDWKRSA